MQQISSQEPVTISAGTTGDMAFSHARGGNNHAKKLLNPRISVICHLSPIIRWVLANQMTSDK
jgi:hypothetical protein